MWKTVLDTSLFLVATVAILTLSSMALLMTVPSGGHGIGLPHLVLILGVTFGAPACIVGLSLSAYALLNNPGWRTPTRIIISCLGVVFLIVCAVLWLRG